MLSLACGITAWLCALWLLHAVAAFRRKPLGFSAGLLVIATHRFVSLPLIIWSPDWHEVAILRLLRLLPFIEVIFCVSSPILTPVPLWLDASAGVVNIAAALFAISRKHRFGDLTVLRIAQQGAFVACLWGASTAACVYWSAAKRKRQSRRTAWQHPQDLRVSIPSVSVNGSVIGQDDAGDAMGISTGQFVGGRDAAMAMTDVTDLLARAGLPDSHSDTGTGRDLTTDVLGSQDGGSTDKQMGLVGPSCSSCVGLQPDSKSSCCSRGTLKIRQLYAVLPDTTTTTAAAAAAATVAAAAVDAADEHAALGSTVRACRWLAPSVHLASEPVDDLSNNSCRSPPLPKPCPVLAASLASVLQLDEPTQFATPSSGGTPEVLRLSPRPGSEAMQAPLPPYTRCQYPLNTPEVVKGSARAYTPFLRHHVTHVKLQGVEPSMIQPGYEERLRNLIHMRTGRWLSHVYVRSGCIELVLDCEEWGSGVLTRGSPCSAWSPCDSHGYGVSAEDADVGVYAERASNAGSGCGGGSAEAAAGGSAAVQRTGHTLNGRASDSSGDGREDRNGQSVHPFVCGSAGGAAGHQPRCSGETGRLGGPEQQGGGGVRTQPRTLSVPHALVGHQLVAAACTNATGDSFFADRSARSEFDARAESVWEATRRPGSVRADGHAHAAGDVGVTALLDSLESSGGGVGTWEFVRALQLQPQPLRSSDCGHVRAGVGSDAAGSSSGNGSPRHVPAAVLMLPSLLDGSASAIATAAADSPLSRALRNLGGGGYNGGGGDCRFGTGNPAFRTSSGVTATTGDSTADTAATASTVAAIAMEPRILFLEGQATTRPICDSTARRALAQARITSLEPRVLLAAESWPPTSAMPVLSGSNTTSNNSSSSIPTGNVATSTGMVPDLSVSFDSGASRGQHSQVTAAVSAAVEQPQVADPPLMLALKAVVRCDSQLLCGGSLELLVRSEGRYLSAIVSNSGPTPATAGDDAATGGDVESRVSYNIELPLAPPSQPLRPGIVLVDLRVHDAPVHAAPIVVAHNAAMASELRTALATAQLSEDDRDALLMDLGTWLFHVATTCKADPHRGSGGADSLPGQAPPHQLGPTVITGIDGLKTVTAGLIEEGGGGRLGMLGMHLLKYALAAGWWCTAASLAADLAAMGVKAYAPELGLPVAAIADITASRTGNPDMVETGSMMHGGVEAAAAAAPKAPMAIAVAPAALPTEAAQTQAVSAIVTAVGLAGEMKAAAAPVLKSWVLVPFLGSLLGAAAAAERLPGPEVEPGADDRSRAMPEKTGLARRRPLHSAGARTPSSTITTGTHGDLPDATEAVTGGGSCGNRSGCAGSALGLEASGVPAYAAGPRPLTALGALLVECGLRRLPPFEEATYQTYAAPRITAQGYVMTILDLGSLATLVIKCERDPSDSGPWVTLLAYWVSVVELLMHAGGAFKLPRPTDWSRLHQVSPPGDETPGLGQRLMRRVT
ncbi:hypothetical protein Vretifemale_6106 [Volvox reticuliferus]|uniref:Uncharacterized protein n=1 Tax=Volvox reticuliferus TaxID=1737510 RepID=A0A8J4FIK0_9CHLO|nr:hypothetical protein Vretifemale_6106 [Volvox reticuliferus]